MKTDRLQMAYDAGFDHFHEDPEPDMITIYRRASNIYDNKDEALSYAQGYLAARLKHEDYLQEKKGARS
jgi:hypothetical protein